MRLMPHTLSGTLSTANVLPKYSKNISQKYKSKKSCLLENDNINDFVLIYNILGGDNANLGRQISR